MLHPSGHPEGRQRSELSDGRAFTTSTYHHDNAFDPMRKCIVAAGFPVICGFGLLAEHHRRAMREEVYRCQAYQDLSSVSWSMISGLQSVRAYP